MTKIVIPVHSVVDLITNSSSEIYTSATDLTTKAIREFVDDLFSVAGSTLRCNDVFDLNLVVEDQGYDAEPFRKLAKDEKEANKIITIEKRKRNGGNDDYDSEAFPRISSQVEITPKPGYENNPAVKRIIKALGGLGDTYTTEDVYN